MACLVREAAAAVAAVSASSSTTKQAHLNGSTGVLACRRSSFCQGASSRVSWSRCRSGERRAGRALRINNVAIPVKEQENLTDVKFLSRFVRFPVCQDGLRFSMTSVDSLMF